MSSDQKENRIQQKINQVQLLNEPLQAAIRHFGKIIKNSQTNSTPIIPKSSLQESKPTLRKGGIRKNKQRERDILLQQNYMTQRAIHKECQNQTPKVIIRSAEQIINQYISLKRSEQQKKEPTLAVLRRKGKGKQQFIKRFQKQVSLDIELRNLKHQISQKDKPELLIMLNQKYGFKQTDICLSSEQYDPFFRGKQIDNLQVFACQFYLLYSKAKNYWSDQILNKFNEQMLSLIYDELCGKSKSEPVTLKTFAKELDIVFGKGKQICLKTRDLFSLYTRLSPFNKENFTSLLKCNRRSAFQQND